MLHASNGFARIIVLSFKCQIVLKKDNMISLILSIYERIDASIFSFYSSLENKVEWKKQRFDEELWGKSSVPYQG